MAKVDPFIQPIPAKFLQDPEIRAWFEYDNRWKHDMWQRTGGGVDLIEGNDQDLTELEEDVAENTANIATNTANISTNANNITTNTTDIATNTADIATNAANISLNAAGIAVNAAGIAVNAADIDDLEADVADLIIAAYFIPVSASDNYTANNYEFVNAKNKATITLPASPSNYSAVIVRNGDGTLIGLNGNGRLINGENAGKIRRKGTALTLQYFIDENEWFAR